VASGTIGQKFRLARFRDLRPSEKIEGGKEAQRGQTNARHSIEGESERRRSRSKSDYGPDHLPTSPT
jgi:hypothetical protein